MVRVKILIDDPEEQFKAGEIGVILPENNFIVALPGKACKLPDILGGGDIIFERQYYFYTDEVEVIK